MCSSDLFPSHDSTIAEALLLAYYGYNYFVHYPEDGNIKVLYTITYANDLKYKDIGSCIDAFAI